MKKLILLFAALSLLSCSDDDSKKEDKYYVDEITITSDNNATQVLDFSYNDKQQIVNISTPGISVNISYEDNRVKTITGSSYDYSFTYNGDKLATIKQGDTSSDVAYDSSQNKYTFSGMEVTLNEYNDILKMNGNEYSYDTSKKGSIASLTTQNNFLLSVLLNLPGLLSSHAVTKMGDINVVNEYNSNGYVSKINLPDGQLYKTAAYTYIKL